MRRKTTRLLLAAIAVVCGLELAEALSVPGVRGVVSEAGAVVGRPMTPVSVAGVARRSARRCSAGVTC